MDPPKLCSPHNHSSHIHNSHIRLTFSDFYAIFPEFLIKIFTQFSFFLALFFSSPLFLFLSFFFFFILHKIFINIFFLSNNFFFLWLIAHRGNVKMFLVSIFSHLRMIKRRVKEWHWKKLLELLSWNFQSFHEEGGDVPVGWKL